MKSPTDDLKAKVDEAKKLVLVGGRYKHYKGNFYRVIDVAIAEADLRLCVIYEAEYAKGLLFTRPLDVWLEKVDVNGESKKRFELVEGVA